MIKFKKLLLEYITNPIIDLKNYLNLSDDEKIEELLMSGHVPDIDEYLMANTDGSTYDKYKDVPEYEIPQVARRNDPDVYKLLYNYVEHNMDNILCSIMDYQPGYPSWHLMEYRNIVKNQWMIHFSNSAYSIYHDKKFDNLMNDYTMLSLTTMHKSNTYNRSSDGFGFSFVIDDIHKNSSERYGSNAVMFRASGIQVYHSGDEEYQTIFYGPTAHDFVFLKNDSYEWSVNDFYKSDNVIDVVNWVVSNYDQYKHKL